MTFYNSVLLCLVWCFCCATRCFFSLEISLISRARTLALQDQPTAAFEALVEELFGCTWEEYIQQNPDFLQHSIKPHSDDLHKCRFGSGPKGGIDLFFSFFFATGSIIAMSVFLLLLRSTICQCNYLRKCILVFVFACHFFLRNYLDPVGTSQYEKMDQVPR